MAGGLFPGKPFAWNVKCVVFTAIVSAGYWFAPHKNVWMLLFLLWFPYVAMAWYDYTYDCANKLQPTVVPFGRVLWLPFKPPGYKQKFDELPPEQIEVMNRVDHVTAWTLFVVAIGLVAYYAR